MNCLFVALAVVLAAALPARAQQLKLDIKDGRVTLEATAVPARQILAAWAEIGGTKVVGAEKITGAPLTLKLAGVPERQALDIILRNVAGFMAAPRQASAAPGASGYDRIMILATTSATVPSAPASTRTNASPANGPGGRRLPPRPPNLQPSQTENSDGDEVQQEAEEQADTGAGTVQPVFTFPAPGSVNGVNGAPGNPVFVPVPNPNGRPVQPGEVTTPVIGLQPNANGQPTIYNFVPNPNPNAPPQPAPSGFTVIGSPQPGMIVQPPPPPPAQQQQPQRPPPR